MTCDTIPENTRNNLIFCIHNAKAGVSKDTDKKEIFRVIYDERDLDYYICKNAKYKVITRSADITLESLDEIKKDNKGYYIEDSLTRERVYLTIQNFSIICDSKCHQPEAYVKEFIPKSDAMEKEEEKEPEFTLVEE